MKSGEVFRANVRKWLEAHGAIDQTAEGRAYNYRLPTPIGDLHIATGPGHIHTRWEFPKAATRLGLASNPSSGKWNWYYFENAATLRNPACFADFTTALDAVLAYTPDAAMLADLEVWRAEAAAQDARWAEYFANA